MAKYEVVFARSARKELERLPHQVGTRVFARIEALAGNPRPQGCRKLTGADDLWRIRVGDYRVLYEVHDARRLVDVLAVRHRGDAYR